MNRTVLVGRMTKDAELRYSQQGTAVASFTIAVNRPFEKDAADFISCVCFKKTAENLANYTKKGTLIGVDGRIQTRNYEGKDGKRVYVTEVLAESVQFLESKGSGEQKPQQQQPKSDDPFGAPIEVSSDDLPF